MNLAKAKDYFSAYYEGSLERGLKQSFESRLREDAQLQAEYRAFERTMQSLEALGHVEIEPPSDLHDKIAAHLDKVIYDQKRQAAPTLSLTAWWKGFVFAGAVAAGLIVAFLKFGPAAASHEMGILPGASPAATYDSQFKFGALQHAVTISPNNGDRPMVTLRDASGNVIDSFDLKDKAQPIQNQSTVPFVVTIETTDQSKPVSVVAIPGKAKDPSTSGQGTVQSLATAIAGHFNTPVIILNKEDASKVAAWDFSSNDPVSSAENAVKPLNLTASQETSGVIIIQKN
jgi:hypothetical protein